MGGLAGIGFAATIVLANVVAVPAGLPLTGSDIAAVDAFFGTHGTAVGVSSALTPLAWVFATVFGAGVVAATPHRDAWSLAGFGGLLMQNATFAGIVAIRLALAGTPDRAALWALHDALFTLNGTFLALALAGLSVGGHRAGLVRRWQVTLGLAAAALLFASATLTPAVVDHAGPLGLLGLAGWLMWVVWLAAYGVTLQQRPAPAVREPASA